MRKYFEVEGREDILFLSSLFIVFCSFSFPFTFFFWSCVIYISVYVNINVLSLYFERVHSFSPFYLFINICIYLFICFLQDIPHHQHYSFKSTFISFISVEFTFILNHYLIFSNFNINNLH